jgi:hypothetical protein
MAHNQRRQLGVGVDFKQARQHPVQLIAKRLPAREPKALAGAPPGGIALGVGLLDIDEPVALPFAPVGFA